MILRPVFAAIAMAVLPVRLPDFARQGSDTCPTQSRRGFFSNDFNAKPDQATLAGDTGLRFALGHFVGHIETVEIAHNIRQRDDEILAFANRLGMGEIVFGRRGHDVHRTGL